MITEGMNIMQSCWGGVMGNGMMGLLTDQTMQTINEKQLVASENAQDRFNAMQSELTIAYHKVIPTDSTFLEKLCVTNLNRPKLFIR